MAQVLIIEDDDRIRPLLMRALGERGYAVSSARTGMDGLHQAVENRPDLVILDLGLPDVDGTQVLSMLRAVSDVPVIIASARDDDPSLVGALDAGADDYVVKPYTTAQLEARIRAVMRRTSGGSGVRRTFVVGGLEVDVAARRATLDGEQLDLSPREFDLLAHLAERAGDVVTKRQLLTDVWHQAWGGSDKTVDVHLSWLRRKLGETASEPRYLHHGPRSRRPARRASLMRRQLIVTVAAVVSMVLLAMLVPTAVLVRDYALEDKLARAALEVQATETVVSGAGQDYGDVSLYLDAVNAADHGIQTTVLYPGGPGVGSSPGRGRPGGRGPADGTGPGRRRRGRGPDAGARLPRREQRPAWRHPGDPGARCGGPGLGSGLGRAWLLLATLGLVLLGGALVLADRLGRSYVRPLAALAERARTLGTTDQRTGNRDRPEIAAGPPEVRDARRDAEPPGRPRRGAARARAAGSLRPVPSPAHPGDRAAAAHRGGHRPGEPARLSADLDDLESMVDHVVREARRSEREGLVAGADGLAVVAERAEFWRPLAEDQDRAYDVDLPVAGSGPVRVRASARTWRRCSTR